MDTGRWQRHKERQADWPLASFGSKLQSCSSVSGLGSQAKLTGFEKTDLFERILIHSHQFPRLAVTSSQALREAAGGLPVVGCSHVVGVECGEG